MKKFLLLCCVLVVALGASAQDADYDDYYGDEADESVRGPSSIAEAKKSGKGYVIGGAGRYSKPKRDVHVVEEGDTLWGISSEYFGDPWRWPQLWAYNPEVTNPHWIYPLDQMRLTPETLAMDLSVEDTGGVRESTPASRMDLAPTVQVSQKSFKTGTVFLRDYGYLDNEALESVGQIMSGQEEHMLMSQSDRLYIKFKEEQDVKAGQAYAVFRTIHDWERNPKEDGTLVRTFGTVLIRSYDRDTHMARAVITEALDPIERGFFVAQVERRFELVQPKRNEKDVSAKVIASIRPRDLLSANNVVFLDVGADRGIEPGNRFFVIRRGDNWMRTLERSARSMGNIVDVPTYDESIHPTEVVAELRVIKVRKETTIALVTRSDTDIFLGDTAEMRTGF